MNFEINLLAIGISLSIVWLLIVLFIHKIDDYIQTITLSNLQLSVILILLATGFFVSSMYVTNYAVLSILQIIAIIIGAFGVAILQVGIRRKIYEPTEDHKESE